MADGSRRRWFQVFVVPLIVVAALLGAAWLGQRHLIYYPGRAVPAVETVLSGWSEVTLTTDDGLQLGAWYRPPPEGRPLVVVFHGNAGTRADRADLGSGLAAAGLGVLLVDYRGYGGNPGSPSEEGLAIDARAAWQFATDRARGHSVVLFGESLGSGVAVALATERPVAALILRSPFTSMPDVARVHYPFLPTDMLLRDQFRSADRIGAIDTPVLVVAGSADSIVPVEQSRRLFDLAREPKRLVIVDGADHNDRALSAGAALLVPSIEFIEEHVAPST